MKTFASLFVIFTIMQLPLIGQTDRVPIQKLIQISDQIATSTWGTAYPGEYIPLYSLQDEVIAYIFNYSMDKPFPQANQLIQQLIEERKDNNKNARWATGKYGYLLMSARKSTTPLVTFSNVVSDYYAYASDREYLVKQKLGNNNFSLFRVYYMNDLAKWYCYTNEDNKIYVKIFPPVMVLDENEFLQLLQKEEYQKPGLWEIPEDENNEWQYFLSGPVKCSKADVFIPDPEYVPYYDWSFGCTPTAFSMALAYWDNRGMISGNDYGNLVRYHCQRWDHVQGETDYNVPDLQRALCIAMSTDSMTGSTGSCCWNSGMISETAARGYSFSGSDNYGTTAQYWSWSVTEINAGRPFHMGTPGHSNTGIGYSENYIGTSDYIIRHDTWQGANSYVNITSCDLVGTIIPGGQYGAAVNITDPFGDPRYSDNVVSPSQGENLFSGDAYEITWDYDYLAGSYVKLYYTLGVGAGWNLITSNTPNDGVYDWVLPSGLSSDEARMKIEVWDASGLEAADGSWGNFTFNTGGSLFNLNSDVTVTTQTDPDYYQFYHSYNTWCAVGIRYNTTGENWSLKMYTDNTFTTELVSSAYSTRVDFVVMDGHHSPSQYRGIKAYRPSGSNQATVEFEGYNETLNTGTNTESWPAGDVVEMYDVYLTPGDYCFDLTFTSGTADLDMALFGSSGSAYYGNRSNYLAISANSGGGVNESFSYTVTTADYYGLCVWANDANSANFKIDINRPGTWTGDVNNFWNNPGNWSCNIIPTSATDVTIPPGTPNSCWLSTNDGNCNNITIESGASLRIYDEILTVYGNMIIYGNLQMEEYIDIGELHIAGDIIWESGSTANITSNSLNMFIAGNWNFESGANVHLDNGYVTFEGNSDKYIRSYESNCYFNNIRSNKTGAYIGVSNYSTETLNINGNLYNYSGSSFNGYSNYPIVLNGFFNNMGGHFLFNFGTFVLNGSAGVALKPNTGDYFHNLTINTASQLSLDDTYSGILDVNGNLLIQSGGLNAQNFTIEVGGDWNNTIGTAGFVEGTSRVVFNGDNYHQYCSNETFNELEVNKPIGGALRMNGTDVVCAAYDWTAGAVDVLTGSFTANDLLDNCIAGAFYTNTGGTINLTNSGSTQYVDLNGELHNFGGVINISGSVSYWPYTHNAVVEMTDGIIDLKTCGLYIYNTATYSLNDNITGGTIRTASYFSGNRADFTPAAGTIELYGPTDSYISQSNGCTVYNLNINKAADDGMSAKPGGVLIDERSGEIISDGSKDNDINLNSDFTVTGDLTVNAGSITLDGFELTVLGSCDVYGTLNMTNATDILNVGTYNYNNLSFNSGSTGNFSAGTVNIYSWIALYSGCSFTATTNNTVNVVGGNSASGIHNSDPASVYGNIVIDKTANRALIASNSYEDIVVNGDFTVNAGNIFEMLDNTMIVHGITTDNATSEIYVYNAKKSGNGQSTIKQSGGGIQSKSGAKGGYLEIDSDFQLTGLMDVGDGNVLIHGNFDQPASGSLIINGGSLISDAPTASVAYLAGSFDMSDGLFEITNNSVNFYPALSTIAGGTIRAGGSFISNLSGSLQPTGGLVELVGSGSTGQYIQVHADNYFHDLTINRTNTIQIYTGYNLNINNDFTILSGGLNTNGRDMYVGGTWDNTVGTNAFVESTGKVVFTGPGPGVQFINSDETFNVLENNTGEAIRVNSAQDTVTCNSYNWISGGVSVLGGTFIANDLAQSGIYGNWFALSGSKILLYQDPGQYVDMFGDRFYISGGLLRIIGGADESYWCASTPLDLDITSGGVLDFDGPGITIYNTQMLNENITDGSIRTSGWFTCYRTDFNPAGGNFEFYGGTDASINVTAGSTLHDVLINKSGGDKSAIQLSDRDGAVIESTKANMAYLSNDLDIEGDLIVDEGTISLNANTLSCYGDININDGGILNVNDNSVLALDYLSYLHANSGGTLNLLGSPGNEAKITHISSSLYSLWIEDGGTISAEHALFEYMAYVYLRPGSTVDPVHSFHYCTFQEGSAGFPLIVFYNTQTLQVNNAVFPTNTWSGPYNVRNTNTGDVTFYNATGGFAGPEFEHDDYNTIHWTTDTYQVDLKVFIEGPFNTGTTKMDLDLNSLGLIPTSQPFNSNPLADWYYTGSESVASIPGFVVDWVLVELRDAPNVASALPGRSIAKQAAFVLNNGDVVGMDGLNPLDFNVAVFNNLYINIWHRNHLGVISANPLINVGGTYSYNFFSGSGQAYGGASAQKNLGGSGIWGMRSGDGNGNGNVGTTDKTNVWSVQAGEAGYNAGDFNLNGQVNNQDKDDYWVPNIGSGSYIPE